MTMLDRGQAALVRRRKQSAWRPVTYTRVGRLPATLAMWIGNSGATRSPKGGATAVCWGDRDYICVTADFAAVFVEPLVGDRITESIAGAAKTFELMPTDNGEPPWRFGDLQFRTTLRFHVKEV